MDPAGLAIRPFRSEDEAAVVKLWSVCFPGEPPWNDPHAVIDRKSKIQPELFLVGVLSEELICTVMGGFYGFRGWVYHLATAPIHRGRGFGRRMMAELERRLASAASSSSRVTRADARKTTIPGREEGTNRTLSANPRSLKHGKYPTVCFACNIPIGVVK